MCRKLALLNGGFSDARSHRPPADKNSGDVHPHGAHQHARDDLVAVWDANHPIETMRPDHGFDAIGNEFARGQRILHPAVTHGDAVINADGVKDERHAARLADQTLHQHANFIQMGVAGDAISVAVADGDERLVEVLFRFNGAGGPKQAAMRRAFGAFFDDVRAHSVAILRRGERQPAASSSASLRYNVATLTPSSSAAFSLSPLVWARARLT